MQQPLAIRMRPQKIDDIVGQEHLTYKDSVLQKMVANEALYSIILYGPPGTGKTSIANVIANSTNADFKIINAVAAGKKDIEQVVKIAEKNLETDKRTILFIDEIHRFNKAQQDYLLPFVENGTVILIGATTENPFFEVNPALVSRSILFQLRPIDKEAILKVIDKAITEDEILKTSNKTINQSVKELIAEQACGDTRYALTLLETSFAIADTEVTDDIVKQIINKPHLQYDKDGDMHYDTISAFIKSMRGSDPDATLYYLAKMIHSGEDPKFIARRILVHASEDVGNADPWAICVAASAMYAVTTIGMPEARINLAQAALYIAMAPKSNTSCMGIDAALEYVANHPTNDIPYDMRDTHYKSATKLGNGAEYKYPHDYPYHFVRQRYLPTSVNEYFYKNSHMGYEHTQAEFQNHIRKETKNDQTQN